MAYHNSRPKTPKVCPVCGEDVPRRALACPECGADHNSGWKEDSYNEDGLDLPDDFSYDDFVKREFGGTPKPSGVKVFWWLTAIAVLAILIWLAVVGR
jgi:hypothetical protein